MKYEKWHAIAIQSIILVSSSVWLLAGESNAFIIVSIAVNSSVAVSMIKKAIRQARTAEISGHLDLLAAFQGITQRTEDHFEGVRALKEKRQPRFRGH